jgi:hypothetical protein
VHTEKRGKPARPLPVDSPVLVITNNDLTDCSDEKLAQIWNTMGLISTRAG